MMRLRGWRNIMRRAFPHMAIPLLSGLVALAAAAQNAAPKSGAVTESVEPPSNGPVLKLDKKYWSGFLSDPKEMIKPGFTGENHFWVKAVLFAGAGLALYRYDENIQRWSQEHKGGTSDSVASAVKPLGQGYLALPLVASWYLIGRKARDGRAQETGRLGFESFILTAAATQFLKFSTHRDRPNESLDHGVWNGPSFSNRHLSFPSGDASSVFAVATIFATEYKEKRWVPPLAYGLAALTAMARVHDNAHWSSDVFVGSVVGYLASKSLYNIHHADKGGEVALLPIVGDGRRGVLVDYRF